MGHGRWLNADNYGYYFPGGARPDTIPLLTPRRVWHRRAGPLRRPREAGRATGPRPRGRPAGLRGCSRISGRAGARSRGKGRPGLRWPLCDAPPHLHAARRLATATAGTRGRPPPPPAAAAAAAGLGVNKSRRLRTRAGGGRRPPGAPPTPRPGHPGGPGPRAPRRGEARIIRAARRPAPPPSQ